MENKLSSGYSLSYGFSLLEGIEWAAMIILSAEVVRYLQMAIGAVAAFSVAAGIVTAKSPRRVIEFQIWAFRRIGWRVEPMNWATETRNTRLMGYIALTCGLLIFIVL